MALTQWPDDNAPTDVFEVARSEGGHAASADSWEGLFAQTAAWGFAAIPANQGAFTPEWKSAGKFGPNRWMLEMEIPFASLKTRPEQKGLDAPSRGDVLGLKLIRWGAPIIFSKYYLL